MAMLKFVTKGDFEPTTKFLKSISNNGLRKKLEKYGKRGVDALSSATPVDTGKTAASWGYTISITKRGLEIVWTNSNVVDGVPIALIIQYGHATRNGGYVKGLDYINPALKPIFEELLNNIWKEVS